MTPGEFIAAFDVIAEAPGGIERLRELVLRLAVRGKLGQQDLGDEPASELLSRAKTAKIQEMIERKIRRDSEPELSKSAGETSSPTHWVWTHLHDFALVLGGKRLPAGASFSTDKTDNIYIRVTDMKDGSISIEDLRYISDDVRDRIAKYTIDREDLYITIAGTIGDVGEVPEHFHDQNLTENAAKIVFREVDKKFLLLVLRSGDVREQFQEKMKQMAQPKLALKRISGARVPLPPLAEQLRIVAKLDELMGLIDRLAATRRSREDGRTAARDSALAALRNAATPEEVEIAWTRIAGRMDALFTTLADLAPLREAVLQLAVRGRLVPQDERDGKGEDLLCLLKKAQMKWKVARRIRKRKDDYTFSDRYVDTPKNWTWTRLYEIGQTQTGTSPSSNNADLFGDCIPFIKPGNMGGVEINYDGPGLSKEGIKHSRLVPANSVLMVCIGATLGKVNKTTQSACFNQQINSLTTYLDVGTLADYIVLVLKSPSFQKLAWSKAGTGTLPIISKSKWEILPIPLPPLAEQHRIVAKIEKLMGLIDRLEQHLVAKEVTQGALAAASANQLED